MISSYLKSLKYVNDRFAFFKKLLKEELSKKSKTKSFYSLKEKKNHEKKNSHCEALDKNMFEHFKGKTQCQILSSAETYYIKENENDLIQNALLIKNKQKKDKICIM